MKYKVGDRVRIKTWKAMKKEFGFQLLSSEQSIACGPGFPTSMNNDLTFLRTNRVVTIDLLSEESYKMCEISYKWTDDMIEGLEFALEKNETPVSRFELMDLE